MSQNHNLEDDFTLISHKKKSNKSKVTNTTIFPNREPQSFDSQDVEKAVRRIESAKEDFLNSNIYQSFKALLTESLLILNSPRVEQIICLGLGAIGECITSRYQLSFLLYLKDRFNVDVSVYDPIFSEFERSILKEVQVQVLSDNAEGKYLVKKDCATIFYLPHCPKQLSNNLLWKNWGIHLTNCIIISNSFHKIIENHTKRILALNAPYITNILPHTTELAVINEFKFYEIFNDTSIHVFPINKLNLLPQEFWEDCQEPNYIIDDIEYIRKGVEGKLSF